MLAKTLLITTILLTLPFARGNSIYCSISTKPLGIVFANSNSDDEFSFPARLGGVHLKLNKFIQMIEPIMVFGGDGGYGIAYSILFRKHRESHVSNGIMTAFYSIHNETITEVFYRFQISTIDKLIPYSSIELDIGYGLKGASNNSGSDAVEVSSGGTFRIGIDIGLSFKLNKKKK
ncbi:MAG: hypothetical protein HQK83_00970 [Fibrobacteria bacterium]|nr:hypothetical protein [Fibrobacteria bacterium]